MEQSVVQTVQFSNPSLEEVKEVGSSKKERALASVQTVLDITLEGGLAIIKVLNWKVFMPNKKPYVPNVGALVVFYEPDAFIPLSKAPKQLVNLKNAQNFDLINYNGEEGYHVKTFKANKQYSQGLVLPLVVLPEEESNYKDGDNVTSLLGVLKWESEPAEHPETEGQNYPVFLRKTDQMRIQNLKEEEFNELKQKGEELEMTEKIDGSSMQVYYTWDLNAAGEKVERIGICSRNLELDEKTDRGYRKMADTLDLFNKLSNYCKKHNVRISVQGELTGKNIQNNRYRIKGTKFFVFDVWDIDHQKFWGSERRVEFVRELGLDHVPVLGFYKMGLNDTVEGLLKMAEGFSVLEGATDVQREGIVFKKVNGDFSFKAISRFYLLEKRE